MSPSSNIPSSASQMQRLKSQLNDLVARERAHTRATTAFPESPPIEAFLQKPTTPKDNTNFMASTRGCSTYPADQLQMMASQLAEARRNGEFPTTKASPTDVDATIEDYQALTRLRQLRGNPMCPAPEAYNHLRIEITRHIRERDALSGEDETEGAAARRVDTYLQAVQHENRYFAAANKSMPQQRRGANATKGNNGQNAKGNANGSDEKMRSMVEQTIEQGIADATGPLRMNVGKLDAQANTLRRQSDTMSQQIEMQQQTVSALQTMIQPQAFNIQATTQNLAMTHGLANQLSQIATELPQAVNQAVSSALQEHTQASIDGLLEAQRQAIHDIEMRTQRLNELNREAEARDSLTRSRTNSTASARDRSRVQSFFQKTFGRTN
ncbi:hypothetical protein BHE90_015798 [Fusarium euwallaceae]|uniref:Uncharacterized protein n=2 Tax=Fusarium solani species complex TaxID=232080 RepID=A0A3M2RHY1_9HYPO|nr:hypothetical protein CDV36_014409 [Fusarium kuroshium]RTE69809.1 hypothetical protein BHE90_015798 [Fusarium euwallaceae]